MGKTGSVIGLPSATRPIRTGADERTARDRGRLRRNGGLGSGGGFAQETRSDWAASQPRKETNARPLSGAIYFPFRERTRTGMGFERPLWTR